MPSRRTTAGRLEFVVVNGPAAADVEVRKLIRSHVMLGKNRGKTFPERKKPTKRVQLKSSPETEGSSSADISLLDVMSVPGKFGAYTSTINFPDGVDPAAVDVVIQCKPFRPWPSFEFIKQLIGFTVSSIAKKLLFPLEQCILFEKRAEGWIAPLAFDPVYLHAMIFSARYYFEVMEPGGSSGRSSKLSLHYSRSLQLLRNRFESNDEAAWVSLPTAAAVMSLALSAHHAGNLKIARIHLVALKKIVEMRGGASIHVFGENVKLLLEILR
jgi:hypothetical protein